MGKSSGSAPKPPDPRITIPLQTQADKDTFQYALSQQRANSYTPYGSQTWTQTPGSFDEAGYNKALAEYNARKADGIEWNAGAMPQRSSFESAPQWEYREQLSPEQQKIYDANTQSQIGQSELLSQGTERVKNALSDPYTGEADQLGVADYLRGLAADSTSPTFNREVGDAVYSQQSRYLEPQMKQSQQALEARLAEQGFVPGTPGYTQAMANFQDTSNRAYGSARDQAVLQGYQQGNTNLSQRQGIAGLLGNGNAQMIAQQLALRNQPLNELNALRTGTQVQAPNAQAQYATPNIQSPDVIGAYNQQYQGNLANYNAQQASNNGLVGALGGIAGAALGGPLGGIIGQGLFSGGGTPSNSYMSGLGGSGLRANAGVWG